MFRFLRPPGRVSDAVSAVTLAGATSPPSRLPPSAMLANRSPVVRRDLFVPEARTCISYFIDLGVEG